MGSLDFPEHSKLFHYNMTAAITTDGFSSSVNIFNYYVEEMMADTASQAIIDIVFYDENGRLGFRYIDLLPPGASEHIDVYSQLQRAGHCGQTIGTAYTRLIPIKLPNHLKGKQVSTECTGEIVTPEGARDFIHNTGAQAYSPNFGSIDCGLMFTGPSHNLKYITLINNYFGPRLPVISSGFAKITVINSLKESRSVRTETVPARGMKLFSVEKAFPDLELFLGGKCGTLRFQTANLARKGWVWFGPRQGWSSISIEHM